MRKKGTQMVQPTNDSRSLSNEPVLAYAPGSPERAELEAELVRQSQVPIEVPLVIGGSEKSTERRVSITAPHAHERILGKVSMAGEADVVSAINAAMAARHRWAATPLAERARVFLRAADLLAGPWRQRLNAATMLGQSKTVHQAEIDSACELIDFLRFNVKFALDLEAQQPLSVDGVSNSLDYRSLDGFVYAVTPFNFTAIGGNLATAPAIMGNVVVWKPASTAVISNYLFMRLLKEAGLPDGVINFVPGDAALISETLLSHPDLAGVHFTGSTSVFDALWQTVARNLSRYRSYPRLVGETGGKDFVVAHASANVHELLVGLIRGAFEYQGQKCSAASRAYIPQSIWPDLRDKLVSATDLLTYGDIADLKNFMGAVIDRKAYAKLAQVIADAESDSSVSILTKRRPDDSAGYFIPPTLAEVRDPNHRLMSEELFGPILAMHIYPDAQWPNILKTIDSTSPYALTGAVFAKDENAIAQAESALRFSAGNFYINDKPTGAVVGQQPFGGSRRSGTNDKAGSPINLLRWVSARTLKRTSNPPTDYRYPHMA
ncbi:L-glutamate gamma-semialdehyde dehydrogenase [Bradyrhizobium sp. BWA-3-5]|uniref:L-glutamate gamma-semialdehyde dehydrogenase n=1 Tax=Bradyrhizobium sp. BWA-3-5 TaxID=3080013 RepID=UPI00397A0FC9